MSSLFCISTTVYLPEIDICYTNSYMSDIDDAENRLNKKIQDLTRSLEELKSVIKTSSDEERRRRDDLAAKSALRDAELKEIYENIERLQVFSEAVNNKLNS